MAIGRTLGRYFAGRFLRAILGVFATVFTLVFLLDFVELVRRAGDAPGATTSLLAGLSLQRTPSIAEQVIPFAVLFGAMAAFLGLSRRLELVVTRAAGVSVWQFGTPAVLVALGLGTLVTAGYNPLAATLKARADAIEAKVLARSVKYQSAKDLWLRQRSLDGGAIVRAKGAADDGTTLTGVTIFSFAHDGGFLERVDAPRAELQPGVWRLDNARVASPGNAPETHATYLVATNLTAEQARRSFTPPANVPFWSLPEVVERTELAGLDANRYRLRYQSLLARPLLLVAMVLVAASVSLRFFRFGGVAPMVLAGVAAGFVLYVATEVVENLGAAGVVSAGLAAWLPASVGTLLGTLALLHQEDG